MRVNNRLSIPELKRLQELLSPLDGSWDQIRFAVENTLLDMVAKDAHLNQLLHKSMDRTETLKAKLQTVWYDEREEIRNGKVA